MRDLLSYSEAFPDSSLDKMLLGHLCMGDLRRASSGLSVIVVSVLRLLSCREGAAGAIPSKARMSSWLSSF